MKKAMRSILSMAALMMLSVAAIAQTSVRGVVVDGSTNETLPGASIIIPGTATGTVTNFDGAFEFEVPDGTKTLLVSFVGFLDKELAMNGTQDFGCSNCRWYPAFPASWRYRAPAPHQQILLVSVRFLPA